MRQPYLRRLIIGTLAPVAVACATSEAPLMGEPSSSKDGGGGRSPASDAGTMQAALCEECTTDTDCNAGERCAQFQGDTFCAATCAGDVACANGTTCTSVSSYSGNQLSVCVPDDDACGTAPGPVSDGAAPAVPEGCDGSSVDMCGSLVAPNVSAACSSCGSSSTTCQTNGCYGGWWCDTSTTRCVAPPTNCAAPSGSCGTTPAVDAGGGTIAIDAGGPVTGTLGANGGTISRLLFTVVGDTRPPNEDDSSGYPTAIIDAIYTDIAALSPLPPFSVSTGDYQFSNPSGTQSATQIGYYLAARAKYSGAFYPAMGNHECTGATASNCGSGNTNGETNNYKNFLSMMLEPIQKTLPYYTININAADGSWTSKFVFVAANAWDSTQSSWLTSAMKQATTYTFVVRHEATGTQGPPGVSPSDAIISGYPYTLLIVGHSHTYGHPSTKEVLIGNGGAPLTGSLNYGYGLFSQRGDGAIVVDMIDYQSKQSDASFHFVVTPTGVLTQ